MTEKVKLTQEQDARLKEMMMDVMYSKNSILLQQAKGWRCASNVCLNTLSLGQLARVLFEPNSYEVEPQFKPGDMVMVRWMNKDKEQLYEILKVNFVEGAAYEVEITGEFGFNVAPVSIVRQATPEEIKTEKERLLWKKIGRKVGEFHVGDITLDQNYYPIRVVNVEMAKTFYQQSKRIGFYPAESFISFEEVDSE
ncbi:hypothetical protein [Psychrobacillus lasiicapitis]|uniref:Uncharacterized protein n=1 Tax=Psychrobacillus lasiicapitis TaxID=1636719 RepID=A0A544TAI3_9BACI|nr:hypothetical protein [Psychrobacillus lasiicapitis]TQR14368.1 hypothetical protein FG382_07885 [Psychrobacillus lasiicapitis]GGA31962.1 hypothetical protein GCM10011384_21900 [Psychrobacillus lasiicapitis]